MAKPKHSQSPPHGSRTRFPRNPNTLLAALHAADYSRIHPVLESVDLKLKELVHKPDELIQHVYFPGGGFCSLLTVLANGNMIEVATIGREGVVGVSALLRGTRAVGTAMVQAAMRPCFRMTSDAYRSEMDRRGRFYELMIRYSQALAGFVMQSTACNAVHSIEQRLARWLLTACDRVGREEFPLTQELAAMMLGASRQTVSVVAGTLQKAGLIRYTRGRVSILDRAALEDASCECYLTSARILRRVVPPPRLSDARR